MALSSNIFLTLILAFVVRAGIIPTTFNLVSSPAIVPQDTLTFGHVNSVVHSTLPLQPPPVQQLPQQTQSLAHPAVVQNAIAESQLPPQLQNNFYKDPNLAASLAKESWFGDKEFPTQHRDADDIPRSEIFKIINRIEHRA